MNNVSLDTIYGFNKVLNKYDVQYKAIRQKFVIGQIDVHEYSDKKFIYSQQHGRRVVKFFKSLDWQEQINFYIWLGSDQDTLTALLDPAQLSAIRLMS